MNPARLGAFKFCSRRNRRFDARPRAGARSAARIAQIIERSRERGPSEPGDRIYRGPWVVCLVAGLSLVLMEYVGVPATLTRILALYEAHAPGLLWGPDGLYASRWLPLIDLSWWIAWRLIGFFVLPAVAIRIWLRRPLRDFGLALHDLRSAGPLYAGLFLLLLPVLAFAAMRLEFLTYYPFYKRAGESWFDLLMWELMYASHFVALEFFFRGFWLEATRRALGVHAIAFMVVPYCMIHFTKPVLEVLAAIPAGIVLGLLAMRTRSIWGGAAFISRWRGPWTCWRSRRLRACRESGGRNRVSKMSAHRCSCSVRDRHGRASARAVLPLKRAFGYSSQWGRDGIVTPPAWLRNAEMQGLGATISRGGSRENSDCSQSSE